MPECGYAANVPTVAVPAWPPSVGAPTDYYAHYPSVCECASTPAAAPTTTINAPTAASPTVAAPTSYPAWCVADNLDGALCEQLVAAHGCDATYGTLCAGVTGTTTSADSPLSEACGAQCGNPCADCPCLENWDEAHECPGEWDDTTGTCPPRDCWASQGGVHQCCDGGNAPGSGSGGGGRGCCSGGTGRGGRAAPPRPRARGRGTSAAGAGWRRAGARQVRQDGRTGLGRRPARR